MRKKRIALLVASTGVLLLSGCAARTEFSMPVSGARSAISSIHLVRLQSNIAVRPSSALGTYVALYLAEGAFLPSISALEGIGAQQRIIAGQVTGVTEEVFALLSELGELLQVNVPDVLDRSTDRTEALNTYLDSLRSVSIAADRKQNELETLLADQKVSANDQRKKSRDIDGSIRDALRGEDYHTAASLQEDSIQAKTALADIETKRDQTESLIKNYKDLLQIATDRLNAIQKNREALIAGVRVTDVPGIEKLDLLERMRRSRTIRSETLFGE